MFITYANDALGANQLHKRVLERALGVALTISLNVAEVTNVASLVSAVAVGLAVWVDYVRYQTCYSSIDLITLMKGYHIQCGPAEVQPLVLSPKV